MKSAIAAFVAAAARYLEKGGTGSIALLITGDEEGDAINGTQKVLAWLKDKGERLDHCIVGEPTSMVSVGDTIKIGRRGSMNLRVTVKGTQGHVAYPPRPAIRSRRSRIWWRGCRSISSTTARRISSRRRWPSPASMSAIPQPM